MVARSSFVTDELPDPPSHNTDELPDPPSHNTDELLDPPSHNTDELPDPRSHNTEFPRDFKAVFASTHPHACTYARCAVFWQGSRSVIRPQPHRRQHRHPHLRLHRQRYLHRPQRRRRLRTQRGTPHRHPQTQATRGHRQCTSRDRTSAKICIVCSTARMRRIRRASTSATHAIAAADMAPARVLGRNAPNKGLKKIFFSVGHRPFNTPR